MHSRLFRALLTTIVLTGALTIGAGAAYDGVATVTAESVSLLAQPSADAEVLTHAVQGDVVLTVAAEAGWYQVDYCTIRGYVPAEAIESETTYDDPLCYAKVETDGSGLNLRQEASTSSSRIGSLPCGALIPLTGYQDGWFQTQWNGKTGYVSADYVLAVQSDGSRQDDDTVVPAAEASSASASSGLEIVEYAKQFIGTPYAYGGSSPKGFDCSGFTSYVYRHFGYGLSRTSKGQRSNGVSVSREQLQPGDIICWSGHVAIYVGDGQCIHAPHSGTSVRIDSIGYACKGSVLSYRRIL